MKVANGSIHQEMNECPVLSVWLIGCMHCWSIIIIIIEVASRVNEFQMGVDFKKEN